MKLGISSWSLPWAIGTAGYPRPDRSLDVIGLVEKAVDANAEVVQIADNLPLHELTDPELGRLRDAAQSRGLTLETGTRGFDPEHLARYVMIARRIGARVLRTVISGACAGRNSWPRLRTEYDKFCRCSTNRT